MTPLGTAKKQKAVFVFLNAVPPVGIETYSFSTGCQYFISHIHEILVNLFDSLDQIKILSAE